MLASYGRIGASTIQMVGVASYKAEWRHFADCVRRDQPVGCTVEDGRRALEVVLAAVASAASGHPVRIGEAPRAITQAEGPPNW